MSGRGGDAPLDRQERLRRDTEEWRAQARELERLRAEVRGSAQREAEAIIERVRADVSEIVQRARAELSVLRAQVRAAGLEERPALPEPPRPPAAPTPHVGSHRPETPIRQDIDVPAADVPRRTHGFFAEAEEPVPAAFPAAWSDEEPETRGRTLKVVVLVALIAAAALAFWWARQSRQSASAGPASGGAPAPAASAASIEDVPSIAVTPTPAPPPSGAPAPSPAAPPAAATAAAPARFEVVFETTRDVWMRVSVDGARDGGRIVPAGERIVVSPEREVTVRAGDAGAVRVSVGGGAAVSFGTEGQPATRTFARPQE